MKSYMFFCIIAITSIPIALMADVINTDDDDLYITIIRGQINTTDCEIFISGIINRQEFPVYVRIEDSPGGDVRAAICIGEILRNSGLMTTLEGTCNSACILIWGAGAKRYAYDSSLFGLHRPTIQQQYFANLSSEEAQQNYQELEKIVRSYMQSMDFPISVIDRMMKTKSSDVDFISAPKFIEIVGSYAVAHQEWLIAKCGELSEVERRDYDATRAELLAGAGITKDLSSTDSNWIIRDAEYAKYLSDGYKEYLSKRKSEISKCEIEAVQEYRSKFLSRT